MKRSIKFQFEVSDTGFTDVTIEEVVGTAKEKTVELTNTTSSRVCFEANNIIDKWFKEISDGQGS
jgi:hypothetical protein